MICPDCGTDYDSNELDADGYCPPCNESYGEPATYAGKGVLQNILDEAHATSFGQWVR